MKKVNENRHRKKEFTTDYRRSSAADNASAYISARHQYGRYISVVKRLPADSQNDNSSKCLIGVAAPLSYINWPKFPRSNLSKRRSSLASTECKQPYRLSQDTTKQSKSLLHLNVAQSFNPLYFIRQKNAQPKQSNGMAEAEFVPL